MITIYKYDINDILVSMNNKLFNADKTSIYMPRGAEVLFVGTQLGNLTVWAKVDTGSPSVKRRFFVYGTGWPMDYIMEGLKPKKHEYIGTCFIGTYVWHIFDGGEVEEL